MQNTLIDAFDTFEENKSFQFSGLTLAFEFVGSSPSSRELFFIPNNSIADWDKQQGSCVFARSHPRLRICSKHRSCESGQETIVLSKKFSEEERKIASENSGNVEGSVSQAASTVAVPDVHSSGAIRTDENGNETACSGKANQVLRPANSHAKPSGGTSGGSATKDFSGYHDSDSSDPGNTAGFVEKVDKIYLNSNHSSDSDA